MEHGLNLLTTVVVGFGIALVFGFFAEKLRIPALVGYLLAGIIVSPATPGYVADINVASQLSEIGVMLLMFGVGLHFSISDLLKVKAIAVPGAIAQMGLATMLGMVCAHFWGWTWGQSFVFGLCLSCASTVVLMKALESRRTLETPDGRIAVGWLVVEDIMTVLILVLLPPLASLLGGSNGSNEEVSLLKIIGMTLGQVIVFIVLMLVIGKRVLPWLLWQVAKTGSRELFTLCVLSVATVIAYGAAEIFNVSFALGAFFAGMVMRESKYAHRAAVESLPLQDAFSVIFFVGVGMMFEPAIIVESPLHLLVSVMIIMIGKSLAAFGLVALFRYPLHTALSTSASLAQIGEFSFILAALGVSLNLLPKEGMSLVLAAAIFSIALNPLAFAMIPMIKKFLIRWKWARVMNARKDDIALMPDDVDQQYLTGHMVVAGLTPSSMELIETMSKAGLKVVAVDRDSDLIEQLRSSGIKAVQGDATEPTTLIQAHVQDCALFYLTMSNDIVRRKALEVGKILNPTLQAVIVTNYAEEAEMAERDKLGKVFCIPDLISSGLSDYALERFGKKENPKLEA